MFSCQYILRMLASSFIYKTKRNQTRKIKFMFIRKRINAKRLQTIKKHLGQESSMDILKNEYLFIEPSHYLCVYDKGVRYSNFLFH